MQRKRAKEKKESRKREISQRERPTDRKPSSYINANLIARSNAAILDFPRKKLFVCSFLLTRKKVATPTINIWGRKMGRFLLTRNVMGIKYHIRDVVLKKKASEKSYGAWIKKRFNALWSEVRGREREKDACSFFRSFALRFADFGFSPLRRQLLESRKAPKTFSKQVVNIGLFYSCWPDSPND